MAYGYRHLQPLLYGALLIVLGLIFSAIPVIFSFFIEARLLFVVGAFTLIFGFILLFWGMVKAGVR